jgi:hypothetical protein
VASSSIRVVKQFNYRGVVRTFSNRYHFGTYLPPDSGHWTTLSDAIVTAEKAIFFSLANNGAKIVNTFGYAAGSEVPVFTKAYTTDGTLSASGASAVPGDVAAMIRYSTPDRSTKNHPIYCFNYYHGVSNGVLVVDADNLLPSQRTAMQTYAASWLTGFSDGAVTVQRSRPQGDLCTGSLVPSLLTHRDLPH